MFHYRLANVFEWFQTVIYLWYYQQISTKYIFLYYINIDTTSIQNYFLKKYLLVTGGWSLCWLPDFFLGVNCICVKNPEQSCSTFFLTNILRPIINNFCDYHPRSVVLESAFNNDAKRFKEKGRNHFRCPKQHGLTSPMIAMQFYINLQQ